MQTISIVVPCYNEQEALPLFYNEITRIAQSMNHYNFEFLFVDDGSSDHTLDICRDLNLKNSRCNYISFSRNFGKEAAIYAGLEKSTGDYVAIMDADLQDPPALLPEMIKILVTENYDSVATRRVSRKGEPPVRSFFAHLFYKLINKISDIEIMDGARDYRLMSRKFVDSLLSLREYNRFSKGLFAWVGFKTKWIEFENVERVAGETKWSFWKLLFYSFDGITAFSTAPLAIAAFIGTGLFICSFIMILMIIIRTLLFGDPVAGWPSLVCIILFIGGVQLLCIGILGQYFAKDYLENKRRPVYICKESSCTDK